MDGKLPPTSVSLPSSSDTIPVDEMTLVTPFASSTSSIPSATDLTTGAPSLDSMNDKKRKWVGKGPHAGKGKNWRRGLSNDQTGIVVSKKGVDRLAESAGEGSVEAQETSGVGSGQSDREMSVINSSREGGKSDVEDGGEAPQGGNVKTDSNGGITTAVTSSKPKKEKGKLVGTSKNGRSGAKEGEETDSIAPKSAVEKKKVRLSSPSIEPVVTEPDDS